MKRNKFYSSIIFWSVVFGIIIYVVAHNIIEREAVREKPYETLATITNLEKCSKYGRCLYYKYVYEGKEYIGRSRTDISFSGWCKDKNDCKGFKFKIIINRDDPEQKTVDWDKIFDDKSFVNYP